MHINRNLDNLKAINVKHNLFKNTLFPSVTNQSDKFDLKTGHSATIEPFKKANIIRPRQNSIFK